MANENISFLYNSCFEHCVSLRNNLYKEPNGQNIMHQSG